MVFDREGYSPEFIKTMWQEYRISCYTYNKYPGQDWAEEEFREEEVKMHNGEIVKMKLAERGTYLGDKIWTREIRKIKKNGHQTSIVTTDFEPCRAAIAVSMFSRWSQENFLKYMMENFGIDRLIEYETTPLDETIEVINPEYRQLESKIKSVSQKLSKETSKFGKITLAMETEKEKEDMEKYLKRKGELYESIEIYTKELDELKKKRKETAKHIQIGELSESEKFSSLAQEKKHIMDTIKMIAYRAETAMAMIIRERMSKPDEAKALLRQIFVDEVDLNPDTKNNILTITIHSLTNEKSNRIVESLCNTLNETETVFPGTNMRLFYNLVST